MVFFDLPMPYEVFDLLNKEILGLTRVGIEAEDTPGSVTITVSSLRRQGRSYLYARDARAYLKKSCTKKIYNE